MDIGKKKSSQEEAVEHWNNLLRRVVEFSSLEGFKRCVNVTLGDTVQCWA